MRYRVLSVEIPLHGRLMRVYRRYLSFGAALGEARRDAVARVRSKRPYVAEGQMTIVLRDVPARVVQGHEQVRLWDHRLGRWVSAHFDASATTHGSFIHSPKAPPTG